MLAEEVVLMASSASLTLAPGPGRNMRDRVHTSILSSSIFLLLTVVAAHGQQDLTSLLNRACGPATEKFSVHLQKSGSPLGTAPPNLSRIVFVSESLTQASCRFTVSRVGVDGRWIGATCVGGYFVVDIAPGVHHLCANYQHARIPKFTALLSGVFTPGSTHYYRVEIARGIPTYKAYVAFNVLHLEPINDDEGRLLVLTGRPVSSKEQ